MINRVAALRSAIAAAGLDGFVVPRADEQLGEYVPACAERLSWLNGFTGSAGLAIVLADRAAVFSDGRYTLQLTQETDGAVWERVHVIDTPPSTWLAPHAAGLRIGYDPWLMSEVGVGKYTEAGIDMVASANLVDAIWHDRPPRPDAPAVAHPLVYAGVSSAEKRKAIAAALTTAGQHAAVVTDTAAVAWLFNLRGADLPFTPVALGFAIVDASERATLFMDAEKLSDLQEWLGPEVACRERSALPDALAAYAGRVVRVDLSGTPAWFAQTLRDAGATVKDGPDPCALPRACKNLVEQDGARAAHRRDAAALCLFLHWLSTEGIGQTESAVARQVSTFRATSPLFCGESFPAIVGAGPNGAVIHYRAMPGQDRSVGMDEVVLIDSGGQYADGTTDVTRTVWTGPGAPPEAVRTRFTRVLQGHIALATAVFPVGVSGPHLDAFARRALWDIGLDYDHGTGHGVGSYLSVHEGPAGISRAGRMVPLAPGMVLSNEPGFYAPGEYGIRLENLMLVQNAQDRWLRFEALTLAPFDLRLVDRALLAVGERAWIDAYHGRVLAEIGPLVDGAAGEWLRGACRALGDR